MNTGLSHLRSAALRSPQTPPLHLPPQAEWRRYLSAVIRYKWLVIGMTILGTVAAGWAARTLDPRYEARAVIWVEVTDPRVRTPEPVVAGGGQLLGATGWVDLLQSHAVLDEVVHSERLYLSIESPAAVDAFSTISTGAEYQPGHYLLELDKAGGYRLSTEGRLVEQGTVGGPIGAAIGLTWTPPAGTLQPGQSVQFTLRSQYETARDLARDLGVVTELGGNFMRLELEGEDREAVASTVNAIARRFVEVATDLKRKKLGELARILSEQLERARQNLSGAEAALQNFRTRTAPVLLGGGMPGTPGARTTADPVLASFIELRGTEEQYSRDRQALERLLATSDTEGLAVDALMFIGSAQRSPDVSRGIQDLTAKQAELRALLMRYTPEHALVKRLQAEIDVLRRTTLPGATRALAAELSVRERELRERVETASGDLRKIPTIAIEDARLRRDVETAEEVFTRIQQRFGEAQLAEVSSLADVRVLDYAGIPERPVGDAGAILVLLGIIGSFGLGAVGAVVLQGFDPSVQDPTQVTGEFGLRILGALPHVTGGGNGASMTVDALRGVRMNVMHNYGAAGPVVLTVSSPSKGDGKSFVALNLAASFADAGHRTLLVDGDIRRGGLHHVLGMRRKPGLMDVVVGDIPLDRALHTTSRANLSFLSCGSRSHSGPEHLSSPAMSQLLVELRKRYDVITIDSPPLAAGIDPYVLGTLTGNLLLVLRLGVTDRSLAAGRLEALARLPIRVLGTVLNGVRERDIYSHYAYVLEGYELRDEESTWAEEKILRS